MSDKTTVGLKRSIKKKLDALRVKKDENYDDILNRLIDSAEETEE